MSKTFYFFLSFFSYWSCALPSSSYWSCRKRDVHSPQHRPESGWVGTTVQVLSPGQQGAGFALTCGFRDQGPGALVGGTRELVRWGDECVGMVERGCTGAQALVQRRRGRSFVRGGWAEVWLRVWWRGGHVSAHRDRCAAVHEHLAGCPVKAKQMGPKALEEGYCLPQGHPHLPCHPP